MAYFIIDGDLFASGHKEWKKLFLGSQVSQRCVTTNRKRSFFFLQLDANGQPLHPYIDSHMGSRSLPNSSSEMCLRSQEEHMETRSNMRKHSSMTRLSRDSLDSDGVLFYGSPRRIVDSCVQTDDEDREERYKCVLYRCRLHD